MQAMQQRLRPGAGGGPGAPIDDGGTHGTPHTMGPLLEEVTNHTVHVREGQCIHGHQHVSGRTPGRGAAESRQCVDRPAAEPVIDAPATHNARAWRRGRRIAR
eukprot:6174974-Pleurochrysis_carterae.AAC.1